MASVKVGVDGRVVRVFVGSVGVGIEGMDTAVGDLVTFPLHDGLRRTI